MTDSQSASQSWCQALSGAQDQIFVTVRQLWFCQCGVLFWWEDGSVIYCGHIQQYMSSVFTILYVGILHSQSFVKSPVPCRYILFTVLHVILVYTYVQYIKGLCQYRLGRAYRALMHVAHVKTDAKSLERSYTQPPPSISLLYILCWASPLLTHLSRWFSLYNLGKDCVEDTTSNGSSIVACLFVATDTCLPCHCLTMVV
jgi:xanthosine utilization system XapX-like protein